MAVPKLWNDFLDRATGERTRKATGRTVIERDELPAEETPFGTVRWYMHPTIPDLADQALYFFELELPPHRASGVLVHQGSMVHLVVAGHGHSIINDVRHEWTTLDVIGVPAIDHGVTLQHFNESDEPARILVTFPNHDSALGPALGADMRIVKPVE
jgi:gentisate 1,2-dioxygenase